MRSSWHPLTFHPILKRALWGGRRLGEILGKPLGPHADYGESWEIADHGEDTSIVSTGPLEGRTIRQLLEQDAGDLLGHARPANGLFPLLVKYIDARESLSVQVHPGDEIARARYNDSGKTEAWLVIAAEPESPIYAGLSNGVTADQFRAAVQNGQADQVLNRFAVQPGDCVFIPAGTVHAIGAGVLLCEVQQMSNTTLRVYDWGRVAADGQPRQLHLEEALQVIDYERGPVLPVVPHSAATEGGIRERLVECPYFVLDRLVLDRASTRGAAGRFTIWIGLEGDSVLEHDGATVPLRRGQTILGPASAGQCTINPSSGAVRVLECYVP